MEPLPGRTGSLNGMIEQLGACTSKSLARRADREANLISLSIGEPEFGPPPMAMEGLDRLVCASELIKHLKRYELSLGSPTLRASICAYYRTYFGLEIDDNQVLITHGGAGAITAAVLACTQPGDDVLIADPSYMLYAQLITVLGRNPRRTTRTAADGFCYDLDNVRMAIRSRTTAMIVNSPENPTGYVCSDSELLALSTLCAERGMTLLHDEVYDQFSFEGRHCPAGRLVGFDNVVQINSTSKKFGVPGLRIGWLVSNPALVAVAGTVQDHTSLAVNSFSERVAELLFAGPGLAPWFEMTRAMLRERASLVQERLGAVRGVEFPSRIMGAMFAFPTVAALAERLRLPGEGSRGEVVADWLLRAAGVAVVPGAAFGRVGDDSIRLALCGPEAEFGQALSRIEAAVSIVECQLR
jgi:aspartate/methionine/tyrosine aminotransferase